MWHPRVPLRAGGSSRSDFKVLLQRMLLKVQARQVSLPEQGDSSNARSSASTRSFSECFRLAEQGCSITSCPSLGCLDTQCQWVNKVRSPIIGVHAQSPLLVLQTSSSWFNTCPTYFPPKTSLGHPKQSRLCCFSTL